MLGEVAGTLKRWDAHSFFRPTFFDEFRDFFKRDFYFVNGGRIAASDVSFAAKSENASGNNGDIVLLKKARGEFFA